MRRLTEAYRIPFPDPRGADEFGMVAWGGNLSPGILLSAYEQGIFPWYSEDPIRWFSPDPRFLLFLDEFHLPRRFARSLRTTDYEVAVNRDFAAVIGACKSAERPGQGGTWITADMEWAYTELHRLGYAHSVEVRRGDSLVGGLYGVCLGRIFAGESMFSGESGAGKVALAALAAVLREHGASLVDCQVRTDLLASFGARDVPRETFLHMLARERALPFDTDPWRSFSWPPIKATILEDFS